MRAWIGLFLLVACLSGFSRAEEEEYSAEWTPPPRDPFVFVTKIPEPEVVVDPYWEAPYALEQVKRLLAHAEEALVYGEWRRAHESCLEVLESLKGRKVALDPWAEERLLRMIRVCERMEARELNDLAFANLRVDVKGILKQDKGKAWAILNGRIVGPGALVSVDEKSPPLRVESIQADRVVVDFQGYRYSISPK
ncbi:MAG: hypothetical protein M5U26_10590 [Planctomycetota bacterium]|nr:hypothetical protein [Planctomycetota bacterium]